MKLQSVHVGIRMCRFRSNRKSALYAATGFLGINQNFAASVQWAFITWQSASNRPGADMSRNSRFRCRLRLPEMIPGALIGAASSVAELLTAYYLFGYRYERHNLITAV